MLEELYTWFIDRGYGGGEIKHDPSMNNPHRHTLYMHGSVSWKIASDSSVPVYLGTAYMASWVVKEINDVTTKVREVYGHSKSHSTS